MEDNIKYLGMILMKRVQDFLLKSKKKNFFREKKKPK